MRIPTKFEVDIDLIKVGYTVPGTVPRGTSLEEECPEKVALIPGMSGESDFGYGRELFEHGIEPKDFFVGFCPLACGITGPGRKVENGETLTKIGDVIRYNGHSFEVQEHSDYPLFGITRFLMVRKYS